MAMTAMTTQATDTRNTLPALLSAKHLMQAYGLTRSMSYQLLNREDAPVVKIGERLFMSRDRFDAWLDSQSARQA